LHPLFVFDESSEMRKRFCSGMNGMNPEWNVDWIELDGMSEQEKSAEFATNIFFKIRAVTSL
jgi:hypothetical protein